MIGLPLIGIVSGYFLMGREVTLTVNGVRSEVTTRALTVRGALRGAGYAVTPQDEINPPANSWLSRTMEIQLDSARRVRIWLDPQGQILEVTSAAKTPAELLRVAGFELSPADTVRIDGQLAAIDDNFITMEPFTLQYTPAVNISLDLGGVNEDFLSSAGWLGMALWKEGFRLRANQIPPDAYAAVLEGEPVSIPATRQAEIKVDGVTLSLNLTEGDVGAALAQAGISLQDLDYSVPGERKPLPEDAKIKVVRVREELVFEQSPIPYEIQSTPDGSMDMTQTVVDQEGVPGVKASRVRVRYEDGVEVSRQNESEVVLVEPTPRISRYGTRLVENVVMTPEGPMTYYLAVDVTATSYSPCRSGVEGQCFYGTAYGLPVQIGVIAVHRSWFNVFKGTRMFVPGYGIGTIADVGYYPYNDNWVDLGYSDDDFVNWGATPVTVYFLSPPPAGFTGVLP